MQDTVLVNDLSHRIWNFPIFCILGALLSHFCILCLMASNSLASFMLFSTISVLSSPLLYMLISAHVHSLHPLCPLMLLLPLKSHQPCLHHQAYELLCQPPVIFFVISFFCLFFHSLSIHFWADWLLFCVTYGAAVILWFYCVTAWICCSRLRRSLSWFCISHSLHGWMSL